jgi:hypothetical protein
MKTMNRLFLSALMVMLLLAATERQAFAYTDPGTGSLIVQALFAAVAGVLFQFRRIRMWLKSRSGPKA